MRITVSSRFQITIPRRIREHLGIQPGMKLEMTIIQDRIECIPVRNIETMRGFLRGMDTTVERE